MLSKIAAGTMQQACLMLKTGQNHQLVRRLVTHARKSKHLTRVNAARAVCNLVNSLPSEELRTCYRLKAIVALTEALRTTTDVEFTLAALDALYRLLDCCGREAVVKFEEQCGEDLLEILMNHNNNAVYQKASGFRSRFFDDFENSIDYDDEFCGIAPALHDESFSFSLPSKQLFPAEGSSFYGSPIPSIRQFGESTYSPNILDTSMGEIQIAQV